MALTVVTHPLAQHYLTHLRDETTKPMLFRTLTRKLSVILALEATRTLRTAQLHIQTPLEEVWSPVLDEEIVLVPILRAGLAMLDSIVDLFPEVSVGCFGMERDERTALAHPYYQKLPEMKGRTAIILDPMLATGGSSEHVVNVVKQAGAERVVLLCVVAAPEGVDRLIAAHPDLALFAACVDRELNPKRYILPGLGDFGDRLYGTM